MKCFRLSVLLFIVLLGSKLFSVEKPLGIAVLPSVMFVSLPSQRAANNDLFVNRIDKLKSLARESQFLGDQNKLERYTAALVVAEAIASRLNKYLADRELEAGYVFGRPAEENAERRREKLKEFEQCNLALDRLDEFIDSVLSNDVIGQFNLLVSSLEELGDLYRVNADTFSLFNRYLNLVYRYGYLFYRKDLTIETKKLVYVEILNSLESLNKDILELDFSVNLNVFRAIISKVINRIEEVELKRLINKVKQSLEDFKSGYVVGLADKLFSDVRMKLNQRNPEFKDLYDELERQNKALEAVGFPREKLISLLMDLSSEFGFLASIKV